MPFIQPSSFLIGQPAPINHERQTGALSGFLGNQVKGHLPWDLIGAYNTLKYADFTRKLAIPPKKMHGPKSRGIGGKKKLNPL
jgi:hypothetical protein